MIENESQTIDLLSVSFKKMFPDLAGRIDEPEVKSWLANSLINIVEYTGTLPQETRKQRDRRMECHKVYDGNYKELAALLRNTYPNERELSPQDLILKVYNGITSVYDVLGASPNSNPTTKTGSEEGTSKAIDSDKLSQDKTQETVSNVQTTPTAEVTQNTGSGYGMPNVAEDNYVEPEKSEVAKAGESVGTEVTSAPISSSESTSEIDIAKTEHSENVSEADNVGDVSSTVIHNDNLILENQNNKEKLEETRMGQMDELMSMVDSAAEVMKSGAAEDARPESNVSADKEQMKAYQIQAINAIQDSLPERENFSKNKRVDAIIIVKQPAAKRAIGTMGTLSYKAKGNNATTPEAEIAKKIQNFITACYGSPIAEDDWKALPEESKYQQVIKADRQAAASKKEGSEAKATNLEKAKKVYDVLTAIKNNPTGEFAAFVNDKNVSYNWKGVIVSGTPMNRTALIKTLVDKSNGGLVGDGSDPANTKEGTVFKLTKATDKAKAKTTGIAGAAHKADKKLVVSVSNKADFTADESHVVCLCTTPAENSESKASFPVAIKPEGFDACAGAFSYVKKDEKGEDALRPNKDKEGQAKFKTGVHTLRVSVPVSDVKKDIAEQFKKIEGYEHPTKLAAYWGVTLPQDKDFMKSDAYITGLLAGFLAGEIGGIEGSDTLKDLDRVRKASQAEADAEEAAQLDQ